MTIQELHYDFKIKMDRVDTLSTIDFNAAEIDWLLKEAQLIFIKQHYSSLSNPKRKGFEESQKRIDDLASLHIKYPLQPSITPTEVDPLIYELPLSSLAFPYLFLTRAYADLTVSDECTLTSTPLKFSQNDDLTDLFRDPFNSPSKEFVPYNIGRSSDNSSSSSLYIYPSYPLSKVYLEYIRYPDNPSLGTYVYLDGVTYPPTTLSTSPHTHAEIVDIAVQLASIATQNPEYVQLKNIKLINNE